MNDPVSLLWSPRHRWAQEIELVNEAPSWSFARYETEIYWRYANEQAKDRTTFMLAQCSDAPAHDAFPFQLHLQGSLMLPRWVNPEYFNGEFRFSVELGAAGICEFTFHIDPHMVGHVETEVKDELQPNICLYVMPIVKIWLLDSYNGWVWSIWSMVLKREHTLGKAMYRRAGTAYLTSNMNFESLFPRLQEELSKDDYLEMDEDGTCTVIVV